MSKVLSRQEVIQIIKDNGLPIIDEARLYIEPNMTIEDMPVFLKNYLAETMAEFDMQHRAEAHNGDPLVQALMKLK